MIAKNKSVQNALKHLIKQRHKNDLYTPHPYPHPDIQNIGEKLIIFRKGGGGYPFTENSAKIINLIFEPFP